MSKLYDQLKNAAFSRRQALERKSRKASTGGSSSTRAAPAGRSPVEQGVVDDEQRRWRDEIEGKLHEADLELIPTAPHDDAEEIREREATMAKLAGAAQRRAHAETRALEHARDRAEAERALHAQSEALLKADLDIATLYAELVPDRELREAIFNRLRDEYERTSDAVRAVTNHAELMDDEPVIQRSIHLRNPYVDPLNYIQVDVLRRLRALPDPEGPEAEALREVVNMTINGIAAGLRNTG